MSRIALDAMGSDQAPSHEVAGALAALDALPPNTEITLVGRRDQIAAALDTHADADRTRVHIVDATDVIGMGEKPLAALKSKPNSSLATAMQLHASGEADAFVSAGNTGAILAAATLALRLHTGVQRAAVGAILPTARQPLLLVDAGANVDCSPREFVGFAHLGTVYARDVLGRPEPTVGLLNIGEEDEKGNQVTKEAFGLLSADPKLRFLGNIEGRDIPAASRQGEPLDVVVCDGFVGNVALKLYEASGRFLMERVQRSLPGPIAEQPELRFLDWSEHGGAPLLGVRGVCIVCHGSSPPNAIARALKIANEAVVNRFTEHVRDEFAHESAAS